MARIVSLNYYLDKYSKNKKDDKDMKAEIKKDEAKPQNSEKSQDNAKTQNMKVDTPPESDSEAISKSKPVSADSLTSYDSSLDVDEVYKDVRKQSGVNFLSKIIFSHEVEYKEPNLNEIKKVSLY